MEPENTESYFAEKIKWIWSPRIVETKKAIYSNRGREIGFELDTADMNRELLRCIAEAIAHLESRLDVVELLGEKFRFYEEEQK